MKQARHVVMTERDANLSGSIARRDASTRLPDRTADFRRRGRVPVPIPLSRLASLEVLVRPKQSACSSAVENFKSPQHHDGGRYQRGHRQHTLQGSDSHFTLRFPSPGIDLVDSLKLGQSSGHTCLGFVERLWFVGHSGVLHKERAVPYKERAPIWGLRP
jgi:hypothetical protein